MKFNFVLLLLILSITNCFGEKLLAIKKRTAITYTYSRTKETGFLNKIIQIDTTVELFDKEGYIVDTNEKYKPIQREYYTVKVDTSFVSQNRIETISTFSDKKILKTIEFRFKDSTLRLTIEKADTVLKEIHYYKNKKQNRYTIESGSYYPPFKDSRVLKNNLFCSVRIETSGYKRNYNRIKIKFNKFLNLQKTYSCINNDSTRKWFVSSITKYNRRSQKIKFKSKSDNGYVYHNIRYKYNQLGYLENEVEKENYRDIRRKTIYFYEFYPIKM